MSKIGKQPVTVPQEVTVKVEDSNVNISGPKGNLTFHFRPEVNVVVEENTIKITRNAENKMAKSLHGLTRSIIANMVKGVTDGHQKVLEIVGTGYRATKQAEDLVLNVGYSHPVIIKSPSDIQIETRENKIIVSGADKVLVGETAAKIGRVRPPEPYKGKGIKYQDEYIRRKVGKAAKTIGGNV